MIATSLFVVISSCAETRGACVENEKKDEASSGVRIQGLHRTYRGEYKK